MSKVGHDHIHLRRFHIHQTKYRFLTRERTEVDVIHLRRQKYVSIQSKHLSITSFSLSEHGLLKNISFDRSEMGEGLIPGSNASLKRSGFIFLSETFDTRTESMSRLKQKEFLRNRYSFATRM